MEILYPNINVDEDFLFAYGFLPRSLSSLLHPRESYRLSKLEEEVLEHMDESGSVHPQDLEATFGSNELGMAGVFPKPPKGLWKRCIIMVISASLAGERVYASINE